MPDGSTVFVLQPVSDSGMFGNTENSGLRGVAIIVKHGPSRHKKG
jgi:hypothetical protein